MELGRASDRPRDGARPNQVLSFQLSPQVGNSGFVDTDDRHVEDVTDTGRSGLVQQPCRPLTIDVDGAVPQIFGDEVTAAGGRRKRGRVDNRLTPRYGVGDALSGGEIAANPIDIGIRARGTSKNPHPIGAFESSDEIPAEVSRAARHKNGVHCPTSMKGVRVRLGSLRGPRRGLAAIRASAVLCLRWWRDLRLVRHLPNCGHQGRLSTRATRSPTVGRVSDEGAIARRRPSTARVRR
jgi:hypothetical protein